MLGNQLGAFLKEAEPPARKPILKTLLLEKRLLLGPDCDASNNAECKIVFP
jgi:hypothetical protein